MTKLSKRIVSIVLSMALLLSIITPQAFASNGTSQSEIEDSNRERIEALAEIQKGSGQNLNEREKENPDELVRVIVKIDKPAAVELSNTNDPAKAKSIKNNVISGQSTIKRQVESITNTKVKNSFGYFVNGFSTTVRRGQIDKIKQIRGVEGVEIVNVYKVDMNYAKELTQATQVWEELGYKGEGIVVSVIDSGIDVNHKDLKLTDIKSAKIKEPFNTKGTYKVPYVYNYADKNYDVLDKNKDTDMHGMHVAGIVAANGDIKGVAPEAQLFAMKVFTNNPDSPGAFADDIVAAIEDSVMLGADVINMSLGAPAGFVDPEDSEQIAIRKAVEKGVMVVVSAGNSYNSTYPVKNPGIPDTGLVGAPGIALEALQVASYENTSITGPAIEYTADGKEGKIVYTTSEVAPEKVLTSAEGYDIVDLGVMSDDYSNSKYNEAKGKIALIQKTGGSFGGKKLNAQSAGAIGVIFYGEDDTLINTAPKDGVTIPCICIRKSDAEILKGYIAAHLKLYFRGNSFNIPNGEAGKMSDFSSWGPTPSLEFKPEITGVGGNIWSLANDNKYQSMSGTSMSSPHVAGAEALILGAKKKQNLNVADAEFINFVKQISMNTSKIILDKQYGDVPVSPRNQGAGLIQIKDAIDNNVAITYEGKAAAALKEIGKERSFELKLTNYGKNSATYELENGGILTEIKSNTDSNGNVIADIHDINIDGATMKFNKGTVTVNPGATETVTVTISLPDGFDTEQFVEGFVKFISKTEGAPSLSVPYIGFYGDWSKPLVMDKPLWDPEHVLYGSRLAAPNGLADADLGMARDANDKPYIIPETIAISTTTADYLKPVSAYLSPVRNAKEVVTQILDKDKNLVRNLGVEDKVRKAIAMTGVPAEKRIYSSQWDLKFYNPSAGEYQYVKDGQYYVRIKSKADYENAKEQFFDMPIKVDSVAPIVEISPLAPMETVSGDYKITWKASDELSGLRTEPFAGGRQNNGWPMVKVNGVRVTSLLMKEAVDEGNGVFSYTIPAKKVAANFRQGDNKVTVQIQDNAQNTTVATANVVLNSLNTTLNSNIVVRGIVNGRGYNNVVDGKITVEGVVSDVARKLTANGVEATIDRSTGNFKVTIPVTTDELNVLTFIAYDGSGTKVSEKIINATFDLTKPELAVDETGVLPTDYEGYQGKIVTTSNIIKVSGKATDKFLKQVTVNDKQITVLEDGSFTTDITVPAGLSNLIIKAEDIAGNIAEMDYLVSADLQQEELQFQFNIASNMILTTADDLIKEDGKYFLPVVCLLNKNVKQIRIQDEEIPVKDFIAGSYVPLIEGINKIKVYIEDLQGNVVADYAFNIYFDATAPVINLTSPHYKNTDDKNNADFIVTPDEDGTVTLTGNTFDNAFGQSLFINGEAINVAMYLESVGPEGTLREFNKKISAKVGDIIEIKSVDLFGYETVVKVKVVDFTELPVNSIKLSADKTSVFAGENINLTATAEFANGKTADVTTDTVWTADNGNIENGVYTAPADYSGKVVIKGTYKGKTAEQIVTVEANTVKEVKLTADKSSVYGGEKVNLKASAEYLKGEVLDITDKAEWSCDKGTIEKGLYTAPSNYAGRDVIKASFGGKTAEYVIAVNNDSIKSLTLTGDKTSINVGDKVSLTVTAEYASGRVADVTKDTSFAVINSSLGTVENGIFTAKDSGSVVITGKFNNISTNTLSINIVSANVQKMVLVTGSRVWIRAGASTSSKKLGLVIKGATLEYLGTTNGWYQVKFNGQTGYISGSFSRVIDASTGSLVNDNTKQIVTITGNRVWVRASAGISGKKLGIVTKGTKLEYLGYKNGWYQVRYNGNIGYIAARYSKIDETSKTPATSNATSQSNKKVVLITGSRVWIRKNARLLSTKIGVASRGARLEYIETIGNWNKVKFNGQIGYISTAYSKVVDN